MKKPEDIERPQIHRGREDSKKHRGDRTRDINPGVAADLRGQVLSADVSLGRLPRTFSFDWLSHEVRSISYFFDDAADDAEASADGARLEAARRAAFVTCESRRP